MKPLRAILLLLFLQCPAVLASGGDLAGGRPLPANTNWPAGLKDLVDQPNRVHGYFVNFEDALFYAGDAAAFNNFLARYVALDTIHSHTLRLHPGPGTARSPWETNGGIPCDWKVRIVPRIIREYQAAGITNAVDFAVTTNRIYAVELDLWLGGNVDLSKLCVPADVTVKLDGGVAKRAAPKPRTQKLK